MNWEEACKYIWRGPLTGTHYQYKIEDGYVYWSKIEDYQCSWTRWLSSTSSAELHLIGTGYTRVGDNLSASHLSPAEKVCKKIRMMEKRWGDFQERKHQHV